MKSGKGKFTWDDGSCYEGWFKNNLFDGEGTFHFLNTQGIYTWSDGKKYEGLWKNGEPCDKNKIPQR